MSSGPSKVIVLDPDPRAGRLLQLGFEREGLPVALPALAAAGAPLDIADDPALVLVGGMDAPSAIDLVRRARAWLTARTADVPIVFTGPAVAARRDLEAAGADEVIARPAFLRDIVTIARMLRGAPRDQRDHLVGSLVETTGVLTLVRAFSALGRSAVLTLIRGLRRGEVRFFHGEVTSAQVGLIHGQAALHQLLLWTDARFDYSHEDIVRRQQIPLSSEELFADAEQFLEGVREHAGSLSPSTVLEQDVQRVQTLGKQIPTEVHGVLRLFDGHRVLADILEDSPYRVFETLRVADKAVEVGLLRRVSTQRPKATWRAVLAIEEWLVGSETRDAVVERTQALDSGPVKASTTPPRRRKGKGKRRSKRMKAATPPSDLKGNDIDWGALVPRVIGAEVGPLAGVVPAQQTAGEVDLPTRSAPREGLEALMDTGKRQRIFPTDIGLEPSVVIAADPTTGDSGEWERAEWQAKELALAQEKALADKAANEQAAADARAAANASSDADVLGQTAAKIKAQAKVPTTAAELDTAPTRKKRKRAEVERGEDLIEGVPLSASPAPSEAVDTARHTAPPPPPVTEPVLLTSPPPPEVAATQTTTPATQTTTPSTQTTPPTPTPAVTGNTDRHAAPPPASATAVEREPAPVPSRAPSDTARHAAPLRPPAIRAPTAPAVVADPPAVAADAPVVATDTRAVAADAPVVAADAPNGAHANTPASAVSTASSASPPTTSTTEPASSSSTAASTTAPALTSAASTSAATPTPPTATARAPSSPRPARAPSSPSPDDIDSTTAHLVAVPTYMADMKSDPVAAVTAIPPDSSQPRSIRPGATDASALVRALVAEAMPPADPTASGPVPKASTDSRSDALTAPVRPSIDDAVTAPVASRARASSPAASTVSTHTTAFERPAPSADAMIAEPITVAEARATSIAVADVMTVTGSADTATVTASPRVLISEQPAIAPVASTEPARTAATPEPAAPSAPTAAAANPSASIHAAHVTTAQPAAPIVPVAKPVDGTPEATDDEPSDGVVRAMIASADTARVSRRHRPPTPEHDGPAIKETTGEIRERVRRDTKEPSVSEPSILVADLAAAHEAIAAVVAKPPAPAAEPARPPKDAASPSRELEVSDVRRDAVAFSEAEEAFFSGAEKTAPVPRVESFDDLDDGYQPPKFWDRVFGRKKPK